MKIYEINLGRPCRTITAGIMTRGAVTAEKQGVFTFRFFDSQAHELRTNQVDLPISDILDVNFRYVPAGKSHSLLQLGTLSTFSDFCAVHVGYDSFNRPPIDVRQLGAIAYSMVGAAPGNQDLTEVSLSWPITVQEGK